jgi:hypothetical protein
MQNTHTDQKLMQKIKDSEHRYQEPDSLSHRNSCADTSASASRSRRSKPIRKAKRSLMRKKQGQKGSEVCSMSGKTLKDYFSITPAYRSEAGDRKPLSAKAVGKSTTSGSNPTLKSTSNTDNPEAKITFEENVMELTVVHDDNLRLIS